MTNDNKDLITAHELAKRLDLSVETIWRYTREGKIPYVRLGKKQYRYRMSEVVDVLAESVMHEKKSRAKDKAVGFKSGKRDYFILPEKNRYRYEVIDGVVERESTPNVLHQRVVPRLWLALHNYFHAVDPDGEVFIAPLEVLIGDRNMVQPDIVYVSGDQQSIIEEERIEGVPSLVVEILSPVNMRKDRLKKMRLFEQAQVVHFWLVNPEEKTLECYVLQGRFYTRVALGMDNDVVEHPEFEGLRIELNSLWNK